MSKHDDDFGVAATPSLGQSRLPAARTIRSTGRIRAATPAVQSRPKVVVRPAPQPFAAAKTSMPIATVVPKPALVSLAPPPVAVRRPAPESAIAAAAVQASPYTAAARPKAAPPPTAQGPDTSGNASAPMADPFAASDSGSQSADWTPPPLDAPAERKAPAAPSTALVKPAPVQQDSWWTRFLSLFGIKRKPKAAVSINGEPTDLRSMTESVVRRARNGDQNAMALIALVRDNAKKGDPKAKESYELLCEYVRCNPVGELYSHRIEGDTTYADAVALSHGPKLLNPRIGAMLAQFNGEGQAAIRFGMQHSGKEAAPAATPYSSRPDISSAIRMGRIMGEARRLQAVREPNSSISKFDVNVGWELGE